MLFVFNKMYLFIFVLLVSWVDKKELSDKLFSSSVCQMMDNLENDNVWVFFLQAFMWWSSRWQLCWEGVTQIFDRDWMCYSTAQPFYSKEKSISRWDHREVSRLSHVVSLNAVYDSLSQAYGLSRSSKAAAASNFFRALLTPRPCETVFNHKCNLLEAFCWHQLGYV